MGALFCGMLSLLFLPLYRLTRVVLLLSHPPLPHLPDEEANLPVPFPVATNNK